MGELAWIRKYRPSSFDEYMGDDVKNLVMNRFKDRNNIPNTIELDGTRGTGKTSMARLMCKEIHCLNPVNGHSCGVCDMCKEIDEYISSTEAGVECAGITEVDAATVTGKSDINDIIEEALIPPMAPLNYKVVIFDECHMLSVAAQNSLLKVVEEPPKHLIMIFCTTDPEKVIDTIHSRIQLKIEVRKKSISEMADKLLQISKLERLTVSKEALAVIAKVGDRIPRECINLLEKVAKNYDNNVTIENVRNTVGDISSEIYSKYFSAANSSLENILIFNKMMKDKDIDPKNFMRGLTRYVLDSLYVKHGISLDEYSPDFVTSVKELFKVYTSSDFDMLLQVIENATRWIDSDDTKSELIITNTALRIGKIQLLAKGLVGESNKSVDENAESVRKYAKILEDNNKNALEKLPSVDIKKESFSNIFNCMSEVDNGDKFIDDCKQNNSVVESDAMDENTKRIAEIFNSTGK